VNAAQPLRTAGSDRGRQPRTDGGNSKQPRGVRSALTGGSCWPPSVGLMFCLVKGRRGDRDYQKAPIFQLVLDLFGLRPVGNDDHSGFVGPSRMPVRDRQAHRSIFSRTRPERMHQDPATAIFGISAARRRTGPQRAQGASASSLNAPQSHWMTQSRICSKLTFCRTTTPQFPHSNVRGPADLIGRPRETRRITRRPAWASAPEMTFNRATTVLQPLPSFEVSNPRADAACRELVSE
jgi:hypothetical protein